MIYLPIEDGVAGEKARRAPAAVPGSIPKKKAHRRWMAAGLCSVDNHRRSAYYFPYLYFIFALKGLKTWPTAS
jgi:hypothetical protein